MILKILFRFPAPVPTRVQKQAPRAANAGFPGLQIEGTDHRIGCQQGQFYCRGRAVTLSKWDLVNGPAIPEKMEGGVQVRPVVDADGDAAAIQAPLASAGGLTG